MKNKRFISLGAFLVLLLCLVFLILQNGVNSESEKEGGDVENARADIDAADDDARPISYDREAVRNSAINVHRRRVAASRELLKDIDEVTVVKAKINAVIQPGETLVTLHPSGPDGRVIMTSQIVTVVKAADGSDQIALRLSFIEADPEFVKINKMTNFQDHVGEDESYVEAWSASEIKDLKDRSSGRKGVDIMTAPSMSTSSGEPSLLVLGQSVNVEFTPELQENGSIHVLSEVELKIPK